MADGRALLLWLSSICFALRQWDRAQNTRKASATNARNNRDKLACPFGSHRIRCLRFFALHQTHFACKECNECNECNESLPETKAIIGLKMAMAFGAFESSVPYQSGRAHQLAFRRRSCKDLR